MSLLSYLNRSKAKAPIGQSFGRRAIHLAIALSSVILLAACGDDDAAAPAVASACSSAISNATGKWVTVVNNTFSPPGPAGIGKNYFSYNQPSINSNGTVVFRGRAKAPAGGGGLAGSPIAGSGRSISVHHRRYKPSSTPRRLFQTPII